MTGHRRGGFLEARASAAGILLGELMEPECPFLAPQELEVWMAGACGRCGSDMAEAVHSGCWLVVSKEGLGWKAGSPPPNSLG